MPIPNAFAFKETGAHVSAGKSTLLRILAGKRLTKTRDCKLLGQDVFMNPPQVSLGSGVMCDLDLCNPFPLSQQRSLTPSHTPGRAMLTSGRSVSRYGMVQQPCRPVRHCRLRVPRQCWRVPTQRATRPFTAHLGCRPRLVSIYSATARMGLR